jgi:hypothetical protein
MKALLNKYAARTNARRLLRFASGGAGVVPTVLTTS